MEIVAIILWLSHTELVLVNRFMVTLIAFSYLFIVLNTFLNCTVMLHIIPLCFRHVYVLYTGICILCFSTNLNSDFCNCLITTVGPLLWELHHPSNFLSPVTKPVSLGQFLLRNSVLLMLLTALVTSQYTDWCSSAKHQCSTSMLKVFQLFCRWRLPKCVTQICHGAILNFGYVLGSHLAILGFSRLYLN